MEPQTSTTADVVHVYRVVIAGARNNAMNAPDQIRTLIEKRIAALGKIVVFTIGCDVAIGMAVKVACAILKVPMIEFSVAAAHEVDHLLKEAAYIARHASLIAIGEEFHVYVSPSRFNSIEDLVADITTAKLPLRVYGNFGQILEQNNWEEIPAKRTL